MTISKNQYVGIVVALAVAAFMFYGMSFLYSKLTNKNQVMNDVQSEITKAGTGEVVAESGDAVEVNYVGMFEDGSVFDQSRGTPLSLTLGQGRVIQGWEKGLLGMKVGEEKRLVIPPALAYGASGYGPIPPNATLIFDVEMVSIKKGVGAK